MENVKTIKKEKDKSTILFIMAMLIVPIISFLFFYVYINFSSILLAFRIPLYDGLGSYEVGIQNFETVLKQFTNTDDKFFSYLLNTLIYFCQDSFINMPLSLVICYFIYKKIALHKVLRVIIYLPIIMTPTIMSILFRFMIEAGGPLQAICGTKIALPDTFIQDNQYALKTILFYSIYSGVGARFVLFGGAMNSIDTSIIEAGKLDGVGPFRELISAASPCSSPGSR